MAVNKTINIELDLKRVTPQAMDIPKLVEGDTGNIFVITLTDDGVPVDLSNCKVLAVFSKVVDGTTAEQDTEDAFIALDDWGIEITGTPANNDTITVTVLDGAVSAVTDISGGTVTVNEKFLDHISENGEYVLTYDSTFSFWKYGDHSVRISGTNHNIITIELKTSSFGAGKNNCELQIYSGSLRDTLVTTAQYNFDGRKGITNPDTIRRSSEYPVLYQLLNQVQRAVNMLLPWEKLQVTIPAGAWDDNVATVSVLQATPNNKVICSPDPASYQSASENGIYCSGQGDGTLTFTALYAEPSGDITMNLLIV